MPFLICMFLVIGAGLLGFGIIDNFKDRMEPPFVVLSKFAVGILATVGVGFFGLALILDLFVPSISCDDSITDEISSPDATHTAYVYTRDCGAVTSSRELVPHILLSDRRHPIRMDKGEIASDNDWWSALWGREANIVVYSGAFEYAKWRSNNHLEICLPVDLNEIPGATSWNDVKISYTRVQPRKPVRHRQ